MNEPETSQLYDKNNSMKFYEDRYTSGYMDEWPDEKKMQIIEVLQDITLPDTGDLLDFGCGNGVLTDILRLALPSWNIYGADVSKTAVDNANIRYENCTFFESCDAKYSNMKFDFIFTNHVFEHVFDLSKVFDEMERYLKPNASMLHFLPCGNEGSYEYNICVLRKDGINKSLGNRFFFEDTGHVRRLSTKEFEALGKEKGFELVKEYYNNHYYGAIEWITATGVGFVRRMTDCTQAIDDKSADKLRKMRRQLTLIAKSREFSQRYKHTLSKKHKKTKDYALLIAFPFYLITRSIDRYYKHKSRDEWETQKFKCNGSEMGLYFKRESSVET